MFLPIIDTPNQQEQSAENYDKILESITKKIPSTAQIILCALKNQKLEIIKRNANVINLTSERLLLTSKYEEILKEFERYKLYELTEETSEVEAQEEK